MYNKFYPLISKCLLIILINLKLCMTKFNNLKSKDMLKGLSYIMIKWNNFLYCMFDVATVIFILGWGLKNTNFENSMILSLTVNGHHVHNIVCQRGNYLFKRRK